MDKLLTGTGALLREEVGHLAQRFLADEISWDAFIMSAPEGTDDEEIAELIDLIEHEPKVGGLFGVSEGEHSRHMDRVCELANVLARSA